jgi:hypothetical protein
MKRLAYLFALLLLAGGVVMGRRVYLLLYYPDSIQLIVALPNTVRLARPVYPFSVVPGGVFDSRDLADSMKHDPVARQHYEGIQPDRLWPTTAHEAMQVYVSYRKGDKVYWTDHQVKIAAGELLLTDGTNLVRGRCGNRIAFRRPSPLPKSVTPPEGPPPDIVFETALPGLVPPTITGPLPPAVVVAQKAPDTRYSPPPVWCCAEKQGGPSVVPEPGTLALLGTGLATTLAFFRRRR